jgi:3-phenylpropionate/trans-cinnamate dioxygenase ferredoxin reductase subunit
MVDRVVIIGTGHAGVQAAASLREEAFDGAIALVGDDADLPYHKPPLSKAFLKDELPRPQVLRAEGFYSGADIGLELGHRVDAIDRTARRVVLSDGTALGFDWLVLATGSRPRLLPLPGADLEGVVALRSLADARALRLRMAEATDVVVVGGGFIGLEVAATLAAAGRRVTVLEAQGRVLGRAVATPISDHVARRLLDGGITILTGVGIARIEGREGHVEAVETTDGRRIPARLVLVGIGAVANVELAAAAGLDVANGIRVDAGMRSSDPRILAIGDAALFRHGISGAEMRLESVQNATDQARLAARTITGRDEAYHAVPWFWSDIGDMKLQMAGLAPGGDHVAMAGVPDDNRFSLFHFRDGRLLAVESVNRPADHMLARRMLAEGFSPPPEAVGDDLKGMFQRWQAARSGATA